MPWQNFAGEQGAGMSLKKNEPGGCVSCGCGGYPTPILIGIPGCVCTSTPAAVSLTYTVNPSVPQSWPASTLIYCDSTTGPPYYLVGKFSYGLDAYFSADPFPTPFSDGDDFNYYRLNCYASQWALGWGEYGVSPIGGAYHNGAGAIFNWTIGGGVNTCSPFLLSAGSLQSGTGAAGKWTVSG